MRRVIKITGVSLFLIYVVCLIYYLFFAESYGRGTGDVLYDYNLQPFREICRYLKYRELLGTRTVLLNLLGNVVGFMPFGALLPIMLREVRKAWRIGLLSFEVSALVEISQLLFQVGCFDVDDMILNTLGGLLGYAVFAAGICCYRRIADACGGKYNGEKEGLFL